MTDLVKHESTAVAPAMDPMAIWNSIAEMATNPAVDAAKIGALLDYQERIMDRAAQQAFTLAKNTAMMRMPRINKDSRIEHNGKLIGKFTKYEDLRRIIDPILNSHGLRLSHEPGFSEGMKMPTVTAVLSFVKDGLAWTEKGGAMVLPMDATGAKSGTQGAGSTLSYGQRYTACAMLGIVQEAEDDDGSAGRLSPDARALTGDEKKLAENGQRAAANGMAALEAWFKELSPQNRAMLVYKGVQENLKRAAAEIDKMSA